MRGGQGLAGRLSPLHMKPSVFHFTHVRAPAARGTCPSPPTHMNAPRPPLPRHPRFGGLAAAILLLYRTCARRAACEAQISELEAALEVEEEAGDPQPLIDCVRGMLAARAADTAAEAGGVCGAAAAVCVQRSAAVGVR